MGYYDDIRIEHAKAISDIDLDGYAIGGLAVGESHTKKCTVLLKRQFRIFRGDKPIYLMGVGTPANILRSS